MHQSAPFLTVACLLSVVGALAVSTCSQPAGPYESGSPPPTAPGSPLQQALAGKAIHPVADGGAYLLGESEVWYIRGTEIVRVSGLGMIEFADLADLYPLADGSALLVVDEQDPPILYSLRGTVATPVKETSTLTKLSSLEGTPAAYFFAAQQQARKRLIQCESSLLECEASESWAE